MQSYNKFFIGDFMFKHLHKLRKIKRSKAVREANELDYNADGSVQINVGLTDSDDFFSPYAYKSYELMNTDVIEYINMCESTIPVKEKISLDIYTETPTTNSEKQRIRKAVKRHHAEQLVIVNKKLRRNLIEGLIFSFIGIIILFVEAILYTKFENMYLDTILAVVGWLFLWDGLEVMLSERHDLKRKKIRSLRLIDAKVHVRKYSKKIQRQYKFGEFEEEDNDDE